MIISRAPLRISFTGGGTDFPDFYKKFGGAVLSCAIDKYITIKVDKNDEKAINIKGDYEQKASSFEKVDHELIRESLKKLNLETGIDIDIESDITSQGSGLGSSSCFTVSLLNALYSLKGTTLNPDNIAKEACQIEIDLLGKPIGKQDQYICAYGGIKHLEFSPNGSVEITNLNLNAVNFEKLQSSLMLFYTGITRQSSAILDEQKKGIKTNEKILLKMKNQTAQLLSAFQVGNIDLLGEILDEAWSLKKQLASRITNAEIDEVYQRAKKAGALGGKIAGAGGGGFLLLYVPPLKQSAVEKALTGFKRMNFKIEKDGVKSL